MHANTLRILRVSGDGFEGDRAHCTTLKATHECALDGVLSEYTHALLSIAKINYSLTVQEAPVVNWGAYDAENGVAMVFLRLQNLFRLYHWPTDASYRQQLAVRYDRRFVLRDARASSLCRHAFAAT